nr:MAG TPA: helix-turn-helix domain protein [Caudoviricetes sp.]
MTCGTSGRTSAALPGPRPRPARAPRLRSRPPWRRLCGLRPPRRALRWGGLCLQAFPLRLPLLELLGHARLPQRRVDGQRPLLGALPGQRLARLALPLGRQPQAGDAVHAGLHRESPLPSSVLLLHQQVLHGHAQRLAQLEQVRRADGLRAALPAGQHGHAAHFKGHRQLHLGHAQRQAALLDQLPVRSQAHLLHASLLLVVLRGLGQGVEVGAPPFAGHAELQRVAQVELHAAHLEHRAHGALQRHDALEVEPEHGGGAAADALLGLLHAAVLVQLERERLVGRAVHVALVHHGRPVAAFRHCLLLSVDTYKSCSSTRTVCNLKIHRYHVLVNKKLVIYTVRNVLSTQIGGEVRMLYELKAIRQRAHLSQKEAAEMLGVNPGTYRNWEQCKNQPQKSSEVKRIADFFGVSVTELYGYDLTEPGAIAHAMGVPDEPTSQPVRVIDKRLEAINDAYDSMNENGRHILHSVATSLAKDPANAGEAGE